MNLESGCGESEVELQKRKATVPYLDKMIPVLGFPWWHRLAN